METSSRLFVNVADLCQSDGWCGGGSLKDEHQTIDGKDDL